MTIPRPTDRLDKWLWHARFFKTRSLASKSVVAGGVRVNGVRVSKPATLVGLDDVLTFPQGATIRVVRILCLATRRGPAADARRLYDDMTPSSSPTRARIGPRPTKKDRRTHDATTKEFSKI